MKTIFKIAIGIVIIALLLAGGYFVYYKYGNPFISVKTKVETKTKIVHDTIFVKSEPIVIEKVKAKIQYLRDTIYLTKPFVASIDTIIQKDTIFLSYNFPLNYFDLIVKQKPQIMLRDTVFKDVIVTKTETNWFFIIGSNIISGLVGTAFGMVVK